MSALRRGQLLTASLPTTITICPLVDVAATAGSTSAARTTRAQPDCSLRGLISRPTSAPMSSATNAICHGVCCRRSRARRLKALDDDPKLLVIRPAAPATSLYHFKPFKLSTALMAVHKDCYAPIGLIQQGGPRRRKTGYPYEDKRKGSSLDLRYGTLPGDPVQRTVAKAARYTQPGPHGQIRPPSRLRWL